MGILLVSCSGLSDWLSTFCRAQTSRWTTVRAGRWPMGGAHSVCGCAPRRRPARVAPPRRGHVRCHHRARRRPPRVACISFWLPLPSATMREGNDARGGRRAGGRLRAQGGYDARGGGAPRRRRARGRGRGAATTRGTVSHMNALPTRQPSLMTLVESALPRGCRTGRSDWLFSTFIFYLGE